MQAFLRRSASCTAPFTGLALRSPCHSWPGVRLLQDLRCRDTTLLEKFTEVLNYIEVYRTRFAGEKGLCPKDTRRNALKRRGSARRPNLRSATALLCLAWAVTGCSTTKPPDRQPDGKALYTTYCVSCHSADGRNDRNGAVPAMRLAAANALAENDWNRLVLNGRGQMPAFHDRLTDSQLRALRVYIRQLTARP